jgi:hypothetical protein
MRAVALGLIAAVIGYAAWNDSLCLLATSALFPLVWSKAPSRLAAGFLAFCYYAAAARGLLRGTQIFFGYSGPFTSTFFGLQFIIASSCILAVPWCLLWTRTPDPTAIAWRLPTALILVSVPPVSCLGWANPITAAGVLFTGWRWYGLAVTVGIMGLSILLKHPSHILALLVLCVISAYFSLDPPKPPDGWKGLNTFFGGLSAQAGFVRFYEQNMEMIETATNSQGTPVILFPEAVAGHWNSTTEGLWKEKASRTLATKGMTVLLGAECFTGEDSERERYDAVIVAVGAESGIRYRQRFPMPISMWRPFRKRGARIHWLDSGVFTLEGRKVAALVCYEQVLIWPVLISMAHQPEVIIAPANAWWSRDTAIPAIQHTILNAWSRLFQVPVITAFNY